VIACAGCPSVKAVMVEKPFGGPVRLNLGVLVP
jgi:hypothetical protein